MPATPNPSPLNGKYLAANPLLRGALYAADAYVSIRFPRRAATNIPTPKRLLLANSAHLGDVLIMTGLFTSLKAYNPDMEIGCVVGSWAAHIVKANPLVSFVHIIDHWKQNRAKMSLFEKYRRYQSTARAALAEMRAIGYDVAIDVYPFFPNVALWLHQARIPVRIGYTSGGFGNLYTHPMDWAMRDAHVLEYHFQLLKCLPNFTAEHFEKRQVILHGESPPRDRATEHCIVLHIGAGHHKKNWLLDSWKQLAARLIGDGYTVVFTGSGSADEKKIQSVTKDLPGSVNLCNQLSWREFIGVIEHAELLIGVDSVSTHIADAVGTPSVTLYTGIQNPHWWKPMHGNGVALTHPVWCAPCYRTNGCKTMECINGVSVEQVYAQAKLLLSLQQRSLNPQKA